MMFYEVFAEQIRLNMNGMTVLFVWAVLNIVVGLAAYFKFAHQKKLRYFFQMNMFWNIINLILAAGTLYYLSRIVSSELDLQTIIYNAFTFEKLLLLNIGLDIAYFAIGSYLIEHGKRLKKVRLEGYGQSLWLQGGFLFLFDLVLYLLNSVYTQKYAFYILF